MYKIEIKFKKLSDGRIKVRAECIKEDEGMDRGIFSAAEYCPTATSYTDNIEEAKAEAEAMLEAARKEVARRRELDEKLPETKVYIL